MRRRLPARTPPALRRRGRRRRRPRRPRPWCPRGPGCRRSSSPRVPGARGWRTTPSAAPCRPGRTRRSP
ncbi:hypothetical protein DI273_03925 [Streptomyces violascens]|nr:hypothetical protein C3K23_28085 [Streptomyces sp. 604F]QOZ98459.1 hypothetical protein DI273_03925 [Streptomyces violascens]